MITQNSRSDVRRKGGLSVVLPPIQAHQNLSEKADRVTPATDQVMWKKFLLLKELSVCATPRKTHWRLLIPSLRY